MTAVPRDDDAVGDQTRGDIIEAQVAFVAGLGQPGEWWTAAQLVALAAATRAAFGVADRPPWERAADVGLVDSTGVLSDSALDAVLRITNHAGTLTAGWFQALELEPAHYVELVAVVAGMNAVDRFADALEQPRLELPEPVSGGPSEPTVDARVTTHWVPTAIENGPNVMRALSAVPSAWTRLAPIGASHYVPDDAIVGDLQFDHGNLDRRQVELVAAATSLAYECFY